MGLKIKRKSRPILLAFVACILFGAGAEAIALAGFLSFQATTPIMTITEDGMRKFDTNITEDVIVIVVDGMRTDQVLWPEYYRALWNSSANGIAEVGIPSYSYPSWTVLSTGAWQETTGVTSNWYDERVKVETVYNALNRSGKRCGVFGATGWNVMCGKGISGGAFADWKDDPEIDDITAEKAYRAILADEYDYYLIHFQDLDEMNHAYGSFSAESHKSVEHTAQLTKDVLSAANLSHTTVIITADHGHRDNGGHGGTEYIVTHVPIMIFGKGARAGNGIISAKQVDVAATVSFLLSGYIPSSCQGVAIVDAFNVPERVKARALYENCLQLKDFADKYTSALGGTPPSNARIDSAQATLNVNVTQSIAHCRAYVVENRNACARARQSAIDREAPTKHAEALLIALIPPIAVLAFLGAQKKIALIRKYALSMVVAFAVHTFVFYLIFVGMGSNFTMSMIESETSVLIYVPIAAVATSVASAAAIICSGARPKAWAKHAVAGILAIQYALLLQALVMLYTWGIMFTWFVPDIDMGVKYFLDMQQLFGSGLGAATVGIAIALLGTKRPKAQNIPQNVQQNVAHERREALKVPPEAGITNKSEDNETIQI